MLILKGLIEKDSFLISFLSREKEIDVDETIVEK